MNAEIDGASRIMPTPAPARTNPIPRKRHEQDGEQPHEKQQPSHAEKDIDETSTPGKSISGGDELDLLI